MDSHLNRIRSIFSKKTEENSPKLAVAKMIYDSVPVLNSLVLADVPPEQISAFFLNVIEGIGEYDDGIPLKKNRLP